MSLKGVPPSLHYTPDPAELQRRIDADASVAVILSRIAEMEGLLRQRSEDILAEIRPLRETNGRIVKERMRLLDLIRRNDAKIRTITERSKTRGNDLKKYKRCLAKRKTEIKNRYVKQLIVQAREQLNRTLPINPVLAKPAEPPVPAVPSTEPLIDTP